MKDWIVRHKVAVLIVFGVLAVLGDIDRRIEKENATVCWLPELGTTCDKYIALITVASCLGEPDRCEEMGRAKAYIDQHRVFRPIAEVPIDDQ